MAIWPWRTNASGRACGYISPAECKCFPPFFFWIISLMSETAAILVEDSRNRPRPTSNTASLPLKRGERRRTTNQSPFQPRILCGCEWTEIYAFLPADPTPLNGAFCAKIATRNRHRAGCRSVHQPPIQKGYSRSPTLNIIARQRRKVSTILPKMRLGSALKGMEKSSESALCRRGSDVVDQHTSVADILPEAYN